MSFSKLGIDSDGNVIEVNQADRREGTYIIGAPGKGKSVLLHNLILQDIRDNIGVIVVDPNRDLISNIIQTMPVNKLDDVILLDIQETDNVFGLNLYECANPTDAKAVQYTMDRVMRIWDRLFTIKRENPLMQHYLRNSAHLIIANPGYTLADIPLVFYDENLRKKLVANVRDTYVKLFWQQYENPVSKLDRSRETSAVLNKFTEYVQPMIVNIIGQAKSTVDFRWCMDNRKIVLLQLDPQLMATTSLIGSTLIALVLQAVFSRVNLAVNKRRQCNVYIDELDYQATLDTQQLYQEGRKFGVTITAAHQSRTRLLNEVPELARGILGAATTVVFQITPPDSDELSGKFDTTPPEPPMEDVGRRKKRVRETKIYEGLLSHGFIQTKKAVAKVIIDDKNRFINDKLKLLDTLVKQSPLREDYIIAEISSYLYHANVHQQYRVSNVQAFIDAASVLNINTHAVIHNKSFDTVRNDILDIFYEMLLTPILEVDKLMNASDKYRFLLENQPLSSWPKRDEVITGGMEILLFIIGMNSLAGFLINDPLEKDSEVEQEVIYKPGQRKTHAERQSEIENQLSNLPRLQARVKLAAFPPQLHSKICQICGKVLLATETICAVCKVPLQSEYVVTIERYNGVYAGLKARRQAIIAKNVQDGFLRDRTVVEAEIAQRQQPSSPPPTPANVPHKTPPAPASGQAALPPTPRKRTIPLQQKQCSACQAMNPSHAKFCLNCGTKI